MCTKDDISHKGKKTMRIQVDYHGEAKTLRIKLHSLTQRESKTYNARKLITYRLDNACQNILSTQVTLIILMSIYLKMCEIKLCDSSCTPLDYIIRTSVLKDKNHHVLMCVAISTHGDRTASHQFKLPRPSTT